MIKVGLTGGIGSGKSTVSSILISKGFKVIDADLVAKAVLEKYPQILNQIKSEFGEGYFNWRGEFKRKEFGNHIFRFPKLRVKYEEIIMPYIKKEINEAFKRYEEKKEKVVVLDAPTLIENNMHREMDYIVVVTAKNSTIISRVRARDKLSNNDILSRINSQMPIDEKKEYADIIIDNNSDLDNIRTQVEDMIKFFKAI